MKKLCRALMLSGAFLLLSACAANDPYVYDYDNDYSYTVGYSSYYPYFNSNWGYYSNGYRWHRTHWR